MQLAPLDLLLELTSQLIDQMVALLAEGILGQRHRISQM